MLVVSRKIGEGVSVNGPFRVVVLGFRKGAVRLGFEADKSVTILRDEVAERIQDELTQGRLAELESEMDQEENQS